MVRQRDSKSIGASKTMVQEVELLLAVGASNAEDTELIGRTCVMAVDATLAGTSGVVGLDEENGDVLSVIDFTRIAGHKPFDITQREWFLDLTESIGMPAPEAAGALTPVSGGAAVGSRRRG